MLRNLVQAFHRFYRLRGLTWHTELGQLCSTLRLAPVANILQVLMFRHLRVWEPEITRLLARLHGNLFVDVGACYGRYSVMLAKNYEQLLAVEPEPRNAETVRRNIWYAGLRNVEVLQVAVSDSDGQANLRLSSRPDAHSLTLPARHGELRVETLTLASILGTRTADLVKVDAEGAEWLVLKGAEPVLSNIEKWVVELHDAERNLELDSWFNSRGYATRWLTDRHIFAYRNDACLPHPLFAGR